MNIINTTTTTQFTSLAPSKLKFKKTYTRKQIVFCDKTNLVSFKYYGSKQKGAFMKDQISIQVKFDIGSDTYTITAKHFNGKTMDSTTVFSFDGMYFDQFADVQFFLN